ncbi:heterokaryon incompatibility protein-domain-containing protein [Suillus placidus]|uniref:Heterokaryon incompatibility protein-domain-containing protein n=1 Tax=Suillus placidus TaxID=48579 RepID=A0A9P7A1Q6_9AGAM|nr:heterokaryon incompatibility protein-domain-containing protein [Suillus placidus]
MLSKFENAPDTQTRKLRQQYIDPSEAERVIQKSIKAQLDDAPHRLLNTFTGHLCDGEAQINAFKTSTEYKELLSSTLVHADLRIERIQDVVAMYFRCVTLSHRWEGKEPLLHDIQDKVVHELNPVGGIVKLQSFCKTARAAGYRWGWIDTCCIDQTNNVELQKSLNSMFDWYRTSALTMVYLSDVPPSSTRGALAGSAWNTRGWTLPEFLAPKVIRFYQNDWTPYLDDHSPNHKQSDTIMQELKDVTGIDAEALADFSRGRINARKKLQWASTRVTTVQEDIAYSLFGIFGVQISVMYGEKKQKALGRLLEKVVAQSGDISALDWVGQSSEFNSCLPAEITSYEAPPYTPPSLSEGDIQTSTSLLRQTVAVDLALKLYAVLDDLKAPRFADCRLHLPCIAFRVTAVTRRPIEHKETYFTYEVKADGLRDLQITTEDKLLQFSRGRPARQSFLLVRPWDRRLLDLPDYADDTESVDDFTLPGSPREEGPVDPESSERAMRLIVRLGQPFSAFLLAQQRSGEYKRIASDRDIITQVKDVDYVHGMDVKTLEIL